MPSSSHLKKGFSMYQWGQGSAYPCPRLPRPLEFQRTVFAEMFLGPKKPRTESLGRLGGKLTPDLLFLPVCYYCDYGVLLCVGAGTQYLAVGPDGGGGT